MNELLGKPEVHGSTLEDVVRSSEGKLFNNAAQAWNHEFYWHSLAPKAAAPSAAMRRRLERDFGTHENFIDKFAAAANGQFGSGWAWLVDQDGKLEVVATSNADTPMAHGVPCLLTLDIGELAAGEGPPRAAGAGAGRTGCLAGGGAERGPGGKAVPGAVCPLPPGAGGAGIAGGVTADRGARVLPRRADVEGVDLIAHQAV